MKKAALVEQIGAAIASRRLIGKGETLLVAVSGGVDSMVLLDVLHRLAPRRGWVLVVAHLNHQLRGGNSEADEALVRKTAERLELNCSVARADVRVFARRRKLSIEMAARQVRHDFLARTAKRVGAGKVILAHHADDQVELFFLRLFRGSGSDGLAGMKWHNPSPANPDIDLVRPLLDIPKASLLEYASEHKVAFREDATNADLDIPRNRVRHELLPLLTRNFQPQLHKILSRTMDILGAESDAALETARLWLGGRSEGQFLELPVAIQRRVIQLQLLNAGVVPEFDQLESLRLNPGWVIEFSRGLPLKSGPVGMKSVRLFIDEEGKLWIVPTTGVQFSNSAVEIVLPRVEGIGMESLPRTLAEEEMDEFISIACGVPARRPRRPREQQVREPLEGTVEFGGIDVSWLICEKPRGLKPKPLLDSEIFDADRVGGKVVLRHWQPGDRFQPIGMKQPIKLQDYFVNSKVPREERHRRVLAVAESGEVFWVEGLRISERFKLTPQTTRSLQWFWKRV